MGKILFQGTDEGAKLDGDDEIDENVDFCYEHYGSELTIEKLTRQGKLQLHLDDVEMSELTMEGSVREGVIVRIDERVENEEFDGMKQQEFLTFS